MKPLKFMGLRWWLTGLLLAFSAQAQAAPCLIPALCGTTAKAASTGYTQTKYPIVLVHGVLGFQNLGPWQYWHGIPEGLSKDGAKVFISTVYPTNSTEARGEELLAYLRMLKASYGHTKFNLVGHSHGGPTVRYVAGVAPDLVASVLLLGSPNQGAAFADVIEKSPVIKGVMVPIFNALGTVISLLGGKPVSMVDSAKIASSLSSAGMRDFNRRFPGGQPTQYCGQGAAVANGVRYYSLGGTSTMTNLMDPLDIPLVLTGRLFDAGKQTDGLVERCSSRWGVVLRDNYPWNHFDLSNMMFGLRGAFAPDPIAMFRTHANRLKLAGL